jgi:hypothetical protein
MQLTTTRQDDGQLPVEEFATLVHELAHEMLHRDERRNGTSKEHAPAYCFGKPHLGHLNVYVDLTRGFGARRRQRWQYSNVRGGYAVPVGVLHQVHGLVRQMQQPFLGF